MFDGSARIENKSGTLFYEQDVLTSNYLFTNDIVIETEIDYLSPGAGIVLLEDSNKIEGDVFVFKIGVNDFTVIRKNYDNQNTELHVSNNISPPYNSLPLTFIKRGRLIEMMVLDRVIGHYTLPKDIDKYRIGFYSNAGNTLKKSSFAAGTPNKWMVNIRNTNGGRVFFFRDGFHIEKCEYDAEIEQDEVFLKKGKYHLKYDTEDLNSKNDIESFVFLSGDKRFDDKEKTLLQEDKSFTLTEDSYVSVKFKGTSGLIFNISIKNNTKDAYVSTDNFPVDTDGSSMIIDLSNLTSVKWKGVINSVPDYDELTETRDYAIISTNNTGYLIEDLNLSTEKKYLFCLDVRHRLLKIYEDDEIRYEGPLPIKDDNDNKVTVFRNINAFIDKLIIEKIDGEEIDILLQKTNKVHIPASIKGPIIVTDEHYIPMELSSSYRVSTDKEKNNTMLFTNWEREIFNPNEDIILEKSIIYASGNIKVYGILEDSNTDKEKIYHINKEVDSIDLYADRYDVIPEDHFEISYSNNELVLESEERKKYKEVIVDYLKEDSYCINYVENIHSYEVDISTLEENICVMSEHLPDGEASESTIDYQVTNLSSDPEENKYIVLRKS